MKIDTKIIKKVLYRIDNTAKKDVEFVESVNSILILMEQEQLKQTNKRNYAQENKIKQ
jgi:hypothetical protein